MNFFRLLRIGVRIIQVANLTLLVIYAFKIRHAPFNTVQRNWNIFHGLVLAMAGWILGKIQVGNRYVQTVLGLARTVAVMAALMLCYASYPSLRGGRMELYRRFLCRVEMKDVYGEQQPEQSMTREFSIQGRWCRPRQLRVDALLAAIERYTTDIDDEGCYVTCLHPLEEEDFTTWRGYVTSTPKGVLPEPVFCKSQDRLFMSCSGHGVGESGSVRDMYASQLIEDQGPVESVGL